MILSVGEYVRGDPAYGGSVSNVSKKDQEVAVVENERIPFSRSLGTFDPLMYANTAVDGAMRTKASKELIG